MKKRKSLQISPENYDRLRKFGTAGESMNDAMTKVFKLLDSKK